MKTGWRFGNLLGIPFYIDYSWLPIAGLMTLSYSLDLSQSYASLSPVAAAVGGLLLALGLFSSVLAHELAHSLVARRQGIVVNSITLFIFGGMASLDRESRTPWAAFWVAMAGPALSLFLGVTVFILSLYIPKTPLGDGLGYLASVNLVIGLFNLIPGLPLDGGQILKAAVWGLTGDAQKGTRWAAHSGQWMGMGLIGLGLYLVIFRGRVGGLWMVLMGFFILNNARNYMQFSQLQSALLQLKAKDVMTRRFRVVDASLRIRDFVDRYLILTDQSEVYFAEADGRYRGLVVTDRLRTVERSEWDHESILTLVQPMTEITGVGEEASLVEVIHLLHLHQLSRLVVLTLTGAVAGLVDKGDIVGSLAKQMGGLLSEDVLHKIRERNEFPPSFQLEAMAERLYQDQQPADSQLILSPSGED